LRPSKPSKVTILGTVFINTAPLDSGEIQKSKRRGTTWLVLSLLLVFTPSAQAGSNFWESIGIGIAAGTVLGASTLPFYDQPGQHTSNIALGAAAGFIVGLGVCIAGLGGDTVEDAESAETGAWAPSKKRRLSNPSGGNVLRLASAPSLSTFPRRPQGISVPLVSLTW